MRVLFVVGSLARGGSEGQMVTLANGLAARGVECRVACLVEGGPLTSRLEQGGVPVAVLGFRARSPVRVARAVLALVRMLRTFTPDVVYAPLFWCYTIALPVSLLVRPRAVRVSGRRSLTDADLIPGHLTMTRVVRRFVNRVTDVVIANSAAVAASHYREDPRLAARTVVIRNAVVRPDVAIGDDAPAVARIVHVANLRAEKRHDVLVDAVALLSASPPWVLDLVGEGPMRASIEVRVRQRGIEDRVFMHGAVDDPSGYVGRATVAVLSSDSEGMPNAVLEAMAAGIPVVATGVGDVPRLLGSGAGTCVPRRDPEALAAAIRAYLDSPAARIRAGAEGRRRAASYGLDVAVDRHLAVFADVPKARRRRRAGAL